MKKLSLKIFVSMCFLLFSCVETSTKKEKPQVDISSLRTKSREAREFCISKGLETDFYGFLVSHGCGNNPWGQDNSKDMAIVSNKEGSHLSSVGKYIIRDRGYSNWGIHINYRLYGQGPTNSNAYRREIVLHSWEKISDEEVYPDGTPEGWGCPAISNASMHIVDNKLKSTNKKVLLWVIKP